MLDVAVPEIVPKKRGGGPKTPEGKQRAKANSMKHGLRAKVLLPEELVASYEQHKAELARQFEPRPGYEGWLVNEMALAQARLDRCADLAVADMQRCLDIAVFDWDDDRRTLVEDLGKRLGSDPSRVAHALEQSRQGADWKIERWEGIRGVLRTLGTCDEDLRRLALDLVGVPPEVRAGDFQVPLASDVAGLTELAGREIARLRERQEYVLNDRDEARRSMAMAGMPYDEDPGTTRLRRYESSIRRALKWAHAELRRVREEAGLGNEPQPPGSPDSFQPPMTGVEETPAVAEERIAAPMVVVDAAVEATSTVERSSAGVPGVTRVTEVFPTPSCTAAHRSAEAPRNRFEQRYAKSQARKAARQASKGR